MEWFKSKAGQLIALATIVSTLAGFGYAGAGYVNRLENLEAKIGGIGDTKQAQQVIEERFSAIETSVEYINKSIDSIVIPDNNDKLSDMKASIASLTNDVERILSDIEKLENGNKNPLAN
jgi:peptidoglycan hydrolase CwlO-like protein